LLKSPDPAANREITAAERQEVRAYFAKTRIYVAEYERQTASLPLSIKHGIELQAALQQAQFIARLYSDLVADKLNVTNAEVEDYISAHPVLEAQERNT